jgi:hypothetical protein
LDFFLFGSLNSEAGISSVHVCSAFSAMIVLIPRWYATWSLKKWQWKREVSCNLGAGGVVKSGVWSLESGVWRNAGREMGMAFLYTEDLLKEYPKFQMKPSPNYFVVSISYPSRRLPISRRYSSPSPVQAHWTAQVGPGHLDALVSVAGLGGARKSGEYHRRTGHKFLRLRVAVNEAWI